MNFRFFLYLLLTISFVQTKAQEPTHIRIQKTDGSMSDHALQSGLVLTCTNGNLTLWEEGEASVMPIPAFQKFTFTNKQYTITTLGEHGTITGAGTYDYGTTITLTALPEAGYHFEQWEDGETTNPRIITITENATYTAVFTQEISPDPTTGNDTPKAEQKVLKVFENGHIIIIKDGVRYTVQGARLKPTNRNNP